MSDDARAGSSRRQLLAAGGTGLLAVTGSGEVRPTHRGRPEPAGGTPEQVHLTWGDDPTRSVVVSWTSPGQAVAPRVRIGQRIIAATERGVADGLTGEVTWTYHARVDGLRPGATYGYAVTADNDRYAPDPFSATFTTAPAGRAAYRFTSFGDLPASNPHAVGAVEAFQPLFHLLNGDLAAPADPDPHQVAQPASAAYRPWMPVPGNHEFGHGEQGLASYLARYVLPSNGLPALEGRWYSFPVGTVAFVCLSGDDDSDGAQTGWIEATLAAARGDSSIDWIVVQLHRCPREPEWLPLFDRYEVDLVLSGHDHGYERSFPVRGFEPASGSDVDAHRPHPVTTVDGGVFDTSQGTVHLVLGCDGSDTADTAEVAAWSARRDAAAGGGIAVFDVNPGTEAGGQTSISVRYFHAAGGDPANPTGDYALFDAFTVVRPRSDGRRWHAR
jgi:hypothetical protein